MAIISGGEVRKRALIAFAGILIFCIGLLAAGGLIENLIYGIIGGDKEFLKNILMISSVFLKFIGIALLLYELYMKKE
jgi:hypothetical protein